jgi:hypothetical protein
MCESRAWDMTGRGPYEAGAGDSHKNIEDLLPPNAVR